MFTVNSNLVSFRDGKPVLPVGSPWQMPAQRTATPGMANQLSAAAQYQPGVGGLAPSNGMARQLGAAAQYEPGGAGMAGDGGGGWTTIAAQRPSSPTGRAGLGAPSTAPSTGMARAGFGPGIGRLSGSADPWTDGTIAAMSGPQARAAYLDWNPFSSSPGMRGGMRGAPGLARQVSAAPHYQPGGSGLAPWGGGTSGSPWQIPAPLQAAPMANQLSATPQYQSGGSGLARYNQPPPAALGGGGFDPRYFAPIAGLWR
jgi:hypothetical protein